MNTGKKSFFSADLCILALISIASIYMFCASIPLSAEAKIFPQVVSTVTFIFCVYSIGKLFLLPVSGSKAATGQGKAAPLFHHFLLIAVALLYVVLLNPVGFLLCTIALFIAVPMILGNRNLKLIIPMAVISSVLFYVIFKMFFYVNLPSGIVTFF